MEFFDGAVGCCSNFSSKFAKRCISKFFFHCWHFHLPAQKISSWFYFQDTCFIAHFLFLIKKRRVDDGFYSSFLIQSPYYGVHRKFTRSISRDLFQSFEPRASKRFLTFKIQISIESLFTFERPWVCVCSNLSHNIFEHTHIQFCMMVLNFASVASVCLEIFYLSQ